MTSLPLTPYTFDLSVLTFQEEKILLLAASDMLNKEFADKLNVSELTVKKHRTNAYKKLNISSKKEVRTLIRYLRKKEKL
jgi:DNA-binding CsgD family transcriptional regulator